MLRKKAEENHISGELKVVTDKIAHEYGLKVNLDMLYQRLNASLAISLATSYMKSENPHFSMACSIARTLQKAELPGRCQVNTEDNTWFISIAHSEVSLKELSHGLKELLNSRSKWTCFIIQLPSNETRRRTSRVISLNRYSINHHLGIHILSSKPSTKAYKQTVP